MRNGENSIDVELAGPTATRSEITTKCRKVECSVSLKNVIKSGENNVRNTDLTDHWDFAFRNDEVGCDIV